MAIYVKAFVFVLFVYFASAMPLEGQEQPEDIQVDLFAIDSVPEQNVQPFGSNDDLTRDKRHHGGEYFFNKK